jgi:hypothetical protein
MTRNPHGEDRLDSNTEESATITNNNINGCHIDDKVCMEKLNELRRNILFTFTEGM